MAGGGGALVEFSLHSVDTPSRLSELQAHLPNAAAACVWLWYRMGEVGCSLQHGTCSVARRASASAARQVVVSASACASSRVSVASSARSLSICCSDERARSSAPTHPALRDRTSRWIRVRSSCSITRSAPTSACAECS